MVILKILFSERRQFHLRFKVFTRHLLQNLYFNDQHLIRMGCYKLNYVLLVKDRLAPVTDRLCEYLLN